MRFVVVAIIVLFVQFYFYFSLKIFLKISVPQKNLFRNICLIYSTLFLVLSVFYRQLPKFCISWVMPIFFILFISQLVSCVVFIIEDARRLIEFIIKKTHQLSTSNPKNLVISRLDFIKWTGLFIGSVVGLNLLFGYRNKYNYQIHRIKIAFKNLPQSFKGLKIIQISDIHSGSFDNIKAVENGINKILDLKPDVIFFTGDLVNNIASEIEPYKKVFLKLNAPLGVYSILGNHDYGDYIEWDSLAEKSKNLDLLKQHHADMGWKLLLNEHIYLTKQNEQIAIIGVENWSAKRFSTHGDMEMAIKNLNPNLFKILLSHDPSHWNAQITNHYKDISLTLSGHTHGMQFGVEIKGFKWSPVQYVYPQWAGLYGNEEQKLYVNRGFGFIGYQGRVGILPEITLIELV